MHRSKTLPILLLTPLLLSCGAKIDSHYVPTGYPVSVVETSIRDGNKLIFEVEYRESYTHADGVNLLIGYANESPSENGKRYYYGYAHTTFESEEGESSLIHKIDDVPSDFLTPGKYTAHTYITSNGKTHYQCDGFQTLDLDVSTYFPESASTLSIFLASTDDNTYEGVRSNGLIVTISYSYFDKTVLKLA